MFDPMIIKIEGEALRVIHNLTQKMVQAAMDAANDQIDKAADMGINLQIFSAYLSSSAVRLACMWSQQQIMLGMENYKELPRLSKEEQDQLIQDVYIDMNTKLTAMFNKRAAEQN